MIKVTLIHNSWIASHNGANTVMRSMLECSELFRNLGVDICQCTYDNIYPRNFNPSEPSSRRFYYSFRFWVRNIINWLSKYNALFCWLFYKLDSFKSSQLVVKYYLDSKPSKQEVAFFHSVLPCYFYLKKRQIKQNTVLVMHTNGDAFQMDRIYFPKLEKSKYFKRLMNMYNYTINNVDRIVFVAEKPKLNFLRLNPSISQNKVFHVHNGIPNKRAIRRDFLNKPIEICCVGSITERKGQEFILDALAKLSIEERNKVHFTLVGDGSLKSKLENKSKELKLQKYITFVGVSSEVDKFLQNSDIFILPSLDEGLPMAIIEAMRASLPIISTPVGGIPEMLEDGYNGIMMKTNVESLYMILKHIESIDWILLGQNSRKLFEIKFSSAAMIKKYADILIF